MQIYNKYVKPGEKVNTTYLQNYIYHINVAMLFNQCMLQQKHLITKNIKNIHFQTKKINHTLLLLTEIMIAYYWKSDLEGFPVCCKHLPLHIASMLTTKNVHILSNI